MDFDNSAFRLLNILELGKQFPGEKGCRTVWSELLGVSVNSPELLARLGKVMELPSLIVTEIQDAYPDESNTSDHWKSQVTNAFMVQQLNGQWATFINNIDQPA